MAGATVQRIEGILLVSLQDDAVVEDADNILKLVGETAVATMAKGVLIDVSALSLVDSYMARTLAELVGMARLLGTDAIIAGIRPEVALAMVELGMELPHIAAVSTVDFGLETLRRRSGQRN